MLALPIDARQRHFQSLSERFAYYCLAGRRDESGSRMAQTERPVLNGELLPLVSEDERGLPTTHSAGGLIPSTEDLKIAQSAPVLLKFPSTAVDRTGRVGAKYHSIIERYLKALPRSHTGAIFFVNCRSASAYDSLLLSATVTDSDELVF
jgi:hypothetical protein